MATAVTIDRQDMDEFLVQQGFIPINLAGTKELVYSKTVRSPSNKGPTICLRVYTTIEGKQSRGKGADAIRCVLVTKVDGNVKIIGSDKRVHRVAGWKANLQERLDTWSEQLGPACPECGAATVQRKSGRGPFWGCCRYPVCRTTQSVTVVRVEPKPPTTAAEAWKERIEEKNEFAKLERAQEEKAYMDEMEAELEASGIYDDDVPPGNW